MRIATWNVNYRGRAASTSLGRLVREAAVEVLLLQEANPASLPDLVDAAGLDWAVSALDAGASLPGTSGRRRVAAVAARGPRPSEVGILPDLALPERMVYARVDSDLGPLSIASYHAPPGVSWGYTKVEHALELLRWVNATDGPLVVGADANTPEVDHPDPSLVRTHWHTGSRKLAGRTGDDVTFGGRPAHRLRDAYRAWLSEVPAEMDRVITSRPGGPLAISHRTGKRRGHPGTPRRFDTLWVSPCLSTLSVTYDYAGGVEAGSDHALVVADLARRGPGPAGDEPTGSAVGPTG